MTTPLFDYHRELLLDLYTHASQTLPFCLDSCNEQDQLTLQDLQTLANTTAISEAFIALGQASLCRIISHYHGLTPRIHRDLLWFFGGDCLHFMPDDEIACYQQLEDRCHALEAAGEPINYAHERAKAFGLH